MGFSCTASFLPSPAYLHGLHLPPLTPIQLPQSRGLSSPLRLATTSSTSGDAAAAAGIGTRLSGVIGIGEEFKMRARKFRVRASGEEISPLFSAGTKLIAVSSAVTVTLAVANRVLYKLALVPMKQYPFFLAQFTTFGYVSVNSTGLLSLQECNSGAFGALPFSAAISVRGFGQ
ncbi:hypothetical protein CRG98_006505 [Punica granatum]|uniref:Uncharacterized protein n=1 Tax=Punica granatum TaxID=22663 RepID=A0A2I0KXA5_PUNGR|nr:hypothetical protein CRG98_006505 [Punica granatum]